MKAAIGVAFVLFGGCSSIINGTKQDIFIESEPPGATATVDGAQQVVTPSTVNLERKKGHSITVRKEEYRPVVVNTEKKMNPWFWGNCLLGGLIGMGIDALVGGMWDIQPERIKVILPPDPSMPLPTQPPQPVAPEAPAKSNS